MTGSQTAADLRHFTSNTNLNTHRLRSSPARSPTSIPSSPTSVHSSSSAIFERDIEPLGPPSPLSSLHSAASDPHRIPRSKTTEQIEHSVPSVLDSAAAILASIQPSDVAVVAPAASNSSFFGGSGFASPIGSFRSRSPSPTIGGPGRAASLLLSIPQHQQQHQQPVKSQTLPPTSPSAVSKPNQQPPKILTENTSPSQPPSIITPTSAYYSVADDETTSAHEDEPATAVRERSPSPLPISPTTLPQTSEVQPESFSRSPRSLSSSPSAWNNNPQNLPPLGLGSPMQSPTSPSSHSPINSASKRLSFVSYADLLTSAPTSTVPLSSLTTAASAVEPPPHITHIAGLSGGPAIGSHPGSRGTSLRGFAMGPHSPSDPFGSPKNVRDSILVDDAGGEWEREGLGKGLEERLDVLYGPAPSITAASA